MSIIVKGRDNYVSIKFSDVTLTSFEKIEAAFNEDKRDSVANPGSVVVFSDTELRLFFGDTTESGGYHWDIVGFDLQNPGGYQLTSKCLGNLPKTTTC